MKTNDESKRLIYSVGAVTECPTHQPCSYSGHENTRMETQNWLVVICRTELLQSSSVKLKDVWISEGLLEHWVPLALINKCSNFSNNISFFSLLSNYHFQRVKAGAILTTWPLGCVTVVLWHLAVFFFFWADPLSALGYKGLHEP